MPEFEFARILYDGIARDVLYLVRVLTPSTLFREPSMLWGVLMCGPLLIALRPPPPRLSSTHLFTDSEAAPVLVTNTAGVSVYPRASLRRDARMYEGGTAGCVWAF